MGNKVIGNCGTCLFWKRKSGKEYGTCVRFPPNYACEQPETWSITVCGEWKAV